MTTSITHDRPVCRDTTSITHDRPRVSGYRPPFVGDRKWTRFCPRVAVKGDPASFAAVVFFRQPSSPHLAR